MNELDMVPSLINNLLENKEQYAANIDEYAKRELYNLGNSAEIAGKYVINQLKEKKKEQRIRKE